jgi:hypothetical protein
MQSFIVMPSVVLLSIIIERVVMLSVIIVSVVMFRIIIVRVFMLRIITVSVFMLNVVIMNVVMLNVVAPLNRLAFKSFLYLLFLTFYGQQRSGNNVKLCSQTDTIKL